MLEIDLIGPMTVKVGGVERPIPKSRKTRALLAYLAMEPRRHRRQRLCELLWELPDDPRAALRWSLTKIRPLLDMPERLEATRDDVGLQGDGIGLDVERLRVARRGADHSADEMRALLALCRGRFLEDCDLPQQPEFQTWVVAVRHELQAIERDLAKKLLERSADDGERLMLLDRLLAIDPYDAGRHVERVRLLAAAGQAGEAEQAAAATRTLFAEAGLLVPAGLGAALATRPDAAPEALPRGVLASVLVLPFEAAGEAVPATILSSMVPAGVVDWLSRHKSLRVFGPTAATGPDVAAQGRAAGAGYVVAGRVLVGQGLVRVRWRLVDCTSGAQLWAGDLERAADDLLALEDEIGTGIAAVVEPKIRFSAVAVAEARPAAGATPRELFLRGLGHAVGDGDFDAMHAVLEEALARDPHFAPAAAFLPWTGIQTGRVTDAASAAHYAGVARRAVQDAPDDVMVQAIGGLMLVLVGHDFEGGRVAIDRAMQLNPATMFVWLARGWTGVHSGLVDEPLRDFDRAELLSPADPTDNNINSGRAVAAFQAKDLDSAARWARIALTRSRSLEGYRVAIAVAHEQGRPEEARRLAGELMQLSPKERARRARLLPFRNRETSERLYAAFVAAGIPD